MTTDDRLVSGATSLHPNKSSGDIGERLEHAKAIAELDNLAPWFLEVLAESAAEIERLRREVENLQRALSFWMPGVDDRLDDATQELAANDAYLLWGYCGPIVERSWGDEILTRALTAESAVAGAYENAAKIVCEILNGVEVNRFIAGGKAMTDQHGNDLFIAKVDVERILADRASAIRAAGAEKTAESGHSPSTHNSASE